MAASPGNANDESPRRERRRLEVRSRIVKAASELFSRQGYRATTVVELAERADVAKKTLFNHFPSKHDILRELAMQVFEDLLLDLERAHKSGASTRERLSLFFTRVHRLHDQTGPMAREMAFELVRATQEAELQRDEGDRMRAAIEAILRDGISLGDVTRRHEPAILAEIISASYFSLVVSWTQDESYPVARKAEEAVAFLAEAVERRPDED